MSRATPAVYRAAIELSYRTILGGEAALEMTPGILAKALDVEEVTEVLAREQWNRLPLVVAGEMPDWSAAGASLGRFADFERQSFRDRVRPFAAAVRASIIGDDS